MNNLIEIIPGLYVSSWLDLSNTNSNLLVKANIISINKVFDTEMKVLNMEIDPNILYIKNKLHTGKINFDSINNFIIESYKNNENTIIYSHDNMILLIICAQFITKYLDINIIETLYYLVEKININKNNLPKYQIFELFNNYIKNIN